MYREDDVFDAAETIRAELPRLVGAAAASLAARLDALLGRERGASAAGEIEAVLAEHDATRRWMLFYLDGAERAAPSGAPPVRFLGGFEPIPGHAVVPVLSRRYRCPEPGCAFVWRCRASGQRVPQCPSHGVGVVADLAG